MRSEKNFPKLNSEQANLVINKMRDVLGPEIAGMMDKSGINPDHMVRFQCIASLCRNTRQQKKISLKQASEKLKIPQYRLKEIESTNIKTIMPDFLDRYIDFLGLTDVFRDWLQENMDIYEGIRANRGK